MSVKEHIESFDELYARLSDLRLGQVHFPLEDIESFGWNRGQWNDPYYNYHYRRFTCHMLSRLALRDGQSALVVGCGFGLDEKNIRHLFPSVELWSVDVSRHMVRLARAGGSPSRFALALAERLPFPDRSFDRVLSREVIEHVIDPAAMLKEIRRVLKPGGTAVVTTENEESCGPTNFYDSRVWPALAGAAGVALSPLPYKDEAPTLEGMRHMAERAGLELVEHFYDGALYKYLIELSPLLKGRMAKAAHYFSCLENGSMTAPAFCDQVKYVLRRPDEASASPARAAYACVGCRGTLSQGGQTLHCSACGARYEVDDGVPDFRQGTAELQAEPPQPTVRATRAAATVQAAARIVSRLLRRLYCAGYIAGALAGTLFVRKNQPRPSGHLRDGDPYERYLRLWIR